MPTNADSENALSSLLRVLSTHTHRCSHMGIEMHFFLVVAVFPVSSAGMKSQNNSVSGWNRSVVSSNASGAVVT